MLSKVEQFLEYSGKIGIHTLDKLVETQILPLRVLCLVLKEFICFQSITLCTMKVLTCPQFDFSFIQ